MKRRDLLKRILAAPVVAAAAPFGLSCLKREEPTRLALDTLLPASGFIFPNGSSITFIGDGTRHRDVVYSGDVPNECVGQFYFYDYD